MIIIIIIIINLNVSNREMYINGHRSAHAQMAEPGIEPRTVSITGPTNLTRPRFVINHAL
jgi:hypothetical protein